MPVPTDRRTDLKIRHRQAIVAAAATLMDDRGTYRFTVEELAEAAGVSRRTIFNHFGSLDDVVGQVCAELLEDFGAELEAAVAAAPGASPAGAVAAALRTVDLVAPMVRLHRAIGLDELLGTQLTPQQETLLLRTFAGIGLRIDAVLRARHPEVDPVDISLLLGTALGGLIALHRHWLVRTGSRDDAESRALWDDLQHRLLRTIAPHA